MKKIIIFFAIFLALSSCKIQIESGLTNASEYLNENENSIQIYKENSSNRLLYPFNCASTDYGRLLFINIDDHPDIKTVELVVQSNGIGSFVVVYYKNGKVECYPNQQLTVDRKYLKPNNDWTVMPINDYQFNYETSDQSLQASFDITIKNDRHISVSLQNNTAQLDKQNFLAAIGADLSEVKRFPMVYLEQAGFLPIENTGIHIQIDGKEFALKKIPVEVNKVKCYKTVYSLNPQPFFWNEECNTKLPYGQYSGQTCDLINGINYMYKNNNGYAEIGRIEYLLPDSKMGVIFSPALPDFLSLKEGTKTKGKFCVNVNSNECIIGGSYTVVRTNTEILLHLNPEKGWQPMPGKPWVSFYDYEACFNISKTTNYHIESTWDVNK